MQKTKPISKDLIRDCRIGRDRERRENTIYSFPSIEQDQLLINIPDSRSTFSQDDTYSIEDFILNIQTQQFLYYNDPFEELEEILVAKGPSIDQVNRQYLERMAASSSRDCCDQGETESMKVSFSGELRAKYFGPDDEPCLVGEREEYVYAMEDEGEDFSQNRDF